MNIIDRIAERLQVDTWVVWLGLGALVVAIIILVRRAISGASSSSTSPNSAGDVLNGPFAGGIDGTTANPMPPSPDGGADTGTTPAPTANPVSTPPPASPRRVTTVVLPSDMTWGQIAQRYAGGSQNAAWLLSWNSQLHSQTWYTVAKGTRINVPQ